MSLISAFNGENRGMKKKCWTKCRVVYTSVGPAKNGKTEHSGFYDLRIERYKINMLKICLAY